MNDLQQLQGAIANPEAFDEMLLIETDDGPKYLSEVMDPWQREDRAVINPALRRVVGQKVEAPHMRVYLERGRGHSKTTDIAVCAAWLLFASQRKLDGVAVAADKDQAQLIRNAIERLVRLNSWLADVLDVQANRVINQHTGSTLTILAADVAGSWGLLIDFGILDECTHWPNRELFDSIFSAIAKKKNGLLLVIANAGFRDHWAWELREAVRRDPAWYFHRLEGAVASWISQSLLDEQRRLLPGKVYVRVWLNDWVDSAGDSLEPADIQACTILNGPQRPRRDRIYVAGLDLGLKHDHSALCVLAADPIAGLVEVCSVQSWRPADFGGSVDLEEVQDAVLRTHQRYDLRCCGFDPWQAHLMAQQLERQGVPMREWIFNSANKDLMARALLEAFRNRLIALYDEPELMRDLLRLRISEGPVGYRLTAIKDDEGHADKAIAMSLILPTALYLAREYSIADGRDEILVA